MQLKRIPIGAFIAGLLALSVSGCTEFPKYPEFHATGFECATSQCTTAPRPVAPQ